MAHAPCVALVIKTICFLTSTRLQKYLCSYLIYFVASHGESIILPYTRLPLPPLKRPKRVLYVLAKPDGNVDCTLNNICMYNNNI